MTDPKEILSWLDPADVTIQYSLDRSGERQIYTLTTGSGAELLSYKQAAEIRWREYAISMDLSGWLAAGRYRLGAGSPAPSIRWHQFWRGRGQLVGEAQDMFASAGLPCPDFSGTLARSQSQGYHPHAPRLYCGGYRQGCVGLYAIS